MQVEGSLLTSPNDNYEHSVDKQLYLAAYNLAEEIHMGRWNFVTPSNQPLKESYKVWVPELERRCPGYTAQEYSQAIAQCLYESR
jgi:hypothetical protein